MRDDDDEYEEPPLVVADEYATEAEAKDAGAELVVHGIGATVEPIPAAELPEDGPRSGYRVMVLEHEHQRALEVLGLVEPEDRPPANPEVPMEPVKTSPKGNWRAIAFIWLAAMIILPLLAFFFAYWVTANN